VDGFDTKISMGRTDFVERSPLTRDALAFAADRHAGQTRDIDSIPFVTHPVEVACLLHEAGYTDEVVAAGVLHDVIEDTDAQAEELAGRFGERVAALVASVSDDPSIEEDAKRKAALRDQVAAAGEEAGVIFAADKVSKARELRHRLRHGDVSEGDRSKVDHYRASLEMLDGLLPGHDLIDQLRTELEAIGSSARQQRHPELAG
jgi:(p)ppGpp synthase/HD superfamily hydrolase